MYSTDKLYIMVILCCVLVQIFSFRLAYPMLSAFLDWPFLIVPSVFSNIYLAPNKIYRRRLYLASVKSNFPILMQYICLYLSFICAYTVCITSLLLCVVIVIVQAARLSLLTWVHCFLILKLLTYVNFVIFLSRFICEIQILLRSS